MIDKQEFYHGVAIIRLLGDVRCRRVQKCDFGYTVNDDVFLFPKYTTKSRSPWRFNFSDEDVKRLNHFANSFSKMIIALICGGDGICAIPWKDCEIILGRKAGWVSARRSFHEQYTVAGSAGALKGKVSLRQWPVIAFE